MNTPYESYNAADFAADDQFQRWVFRPDASSERFWGEYLRQYPEKSPLIAEARTILLRLAQEDEAPVPADRRHVVWEKIQHELAGEWQSAPVRQSRVRALWQMAASVAAVLLLVATWFFWLRPSHPTVYTTQSGEKKVILLPDSSEVTLNAQSSLRLADHWDGQRVREVWLEGEGYFNVRRKPDAGNGKRFVVHTKDLNVEVLGTSFNVRTRRESTQVVLSEGKVKVEPLAAVQPVFMVPGESVTVAEKQNITKTSVNPALYSAWKSNELVLDHTSLREIGRFIGETYGLSVVYENDSVANLVLDGTALPTGNRDYFLKAVCLTLDIQYSLDGKQVLFRKK